MEKKYLIFRDALFEESLGIKNVEVYVEQLKQEALWEICDLKDLSLKLTEDYDVFVNLYGGYFPKNIFCDIEVFLKKGKGFISFNGMAFEIPCIYDQNKNVWVPGKRKLSYIRRLNVHSVLTVDTTDVVIYENTDESEIMKGFDFFDPDSSSQNLILIPTKDKYIQREWGSAGSMDSKISSLINGVNEEREPRCSTAVLIEHRAGKFTGGSWIIVTQKLAESGNHGFEAVLERMCMCVAQGYTEFLIKPSFAIYRTGEIPSISVNLQQYDGMREIILRISVLDPTNRQIIEHDTLMKISDKIEQHTFTIKEASMGGCYSIIGEIVDKTGVLRRVKQGFIIEPQSVREKFSAFRPGRDYFIQDGKQTPVIGMTYMSGEVGRAFLHIPNTQLWLSEMKSMRAMGVNWIRTGIWTNWRTYMLDDGHMDEFVLRSIEAFVTCAAINQIHVTFTFFSFVPEPWEGSHPYLDRRSVDAQKRFISNIVSRFEEYNNVDWDLINEPYTFDHPTQKKSVEDTCEREAYIKYIREQYHNDTDEYSEKMDCILDDFEKLQIPLSEEINFAVDDMSQGKNGLCWRDYNMFMHHMFREWVAELKGHIGKYSTQMVTVGQDEALRSCRPVPMTYGNLLDYDAQHTWWRLEDLGWDTIFSKSQKRPLLVQETGVMYVENANGFPRRQEKDIADLLRKKYAYAFGTKCAGVIQWVWNSNYYLDSANESNIGALRCDGSYKPEVYVTREFARFFEGASEYISDIRRNDIAVVFPFSNGFSNKRFAQRATSAITRIFTNYLHIGFDGISEFALEELEDKGYKVIIIPAPHNLSEQARKQLRRLAEKEKLTIIFTGPISLDENYQQAEDLLGAPAGYKALKQWESVRFQGREYSFRFDQYEFLTALKGEYNKNEIHQYQIGQSQMYHIGVPVELSGQMGSIAALYQELLQSIDYRRRFSVKSSQNIDALFISCICWDKARMYTAINETDEEKDIVITDYETNTEINIVLSGSGVEMFVLDKEGQVVIRNYEEMNLKERGV